MTMLPRIDVETAHGVVPLWGRFDTFDDARKLVFSIPGAFTGPNYMSALPDLLGDCDVVLARLPGMFAPHLRTISIAAFAQAFDEALSARFRERRVLRLGYSVGGLVAMAMRRGDAIVAVDPPLTPAKLWPIWSPLRQEATANNDPRIAEWIDAIFGISPTSVVERDYRPLLAALDVPGVAVIGGEPLEPVREFTLSQAPGLLTAADRKMLADHPLLQTVTALGCGHAIPSRAAHLLLWAIRAGLNLVPGRKAGRDRACEWR